MLEKFAMGFSKALSTAPALNWAGCMNTARAAAAPVHKGKTGPWQGIHKKPTARGETAMQHSWHTPNTHRQEEKVSVEMNAYSEGWGIWEFKEGFL